MEGQKTSQAQQDWTSRRQPSIVRLVADLDRSVTVFGRLHLVHWVVVAQSRLKKVNPRVFHGN